MYNVNLANSHYRVSQLGLGCMGMSEFYGSSDKKQSLQTLHHAFEAGINFYDTADMYGYGDNEMLLKEFIKGKRDQLVIATKFGIVRSKTHHYNRFINNSASYIKQACEASLKRMGIDCIDLYYAHRVDPSQPIEIMMEALADLVKAGKIKAVGLCDISAEMLYKAHSVFPVSAVQTEYSLWNRDPEISLLPACHDLNISLVAYCPLGRGFLAKNFNSINELDSLDFRRHLPRFSEKNLAANQHLLQPVQDIALKNNMSMAQLALCWLFAQGDNVIAIPGCRKIHHLEDNINSTTQSLSKQDMENLNKLMPIGIAQGDRYSVEGMKGVFV